MPLARRFAARVPRPRVAWAIVVLAACSHDDDRERKELADKVDDVGGEARKASDRIDELEKKVDELDNKLDLLTKLAAQQQQQAAIPPPPPRPSYARNDPDPDTVFAVPIDGDAVEGPADAWVTIVEGSDYACPFCFRSRDTMAALRQKYGKDLRVVHKAFVVHPSEATAAALGACAAQRQGKWAKLDKLLWDEGFSKQAYGADVVRGLAKKAGLDLNAYDQDVAGSCQDIIQKDQSDLAAVGQRATPTFYINGRYLSGAQPIDGFARIVDEELAKAKASGLDRADYYEASVLANGKRTFP